MRKSEKQMEQQSRLRFMGCTPPSAAEVAAGDERLDAVMAEIDLRVAVELAKAGLS